MTPAPHYHSYESIGNSEVKAIEVFCAPRVKVYHMFYSENSKIEACSKVFKEETCRILEADTFFDKVKYTKSIRINDGHFHRLFFNDTLKMSIDDSSKKLLFIPVE
ncbi:hypothetical protein GCM10011444_21770 [Winogradskyella haliclonae]|uniref:Uncharacterized protein n=2 Tax=Winogradskyella haliclonae TaxID=2048558 RepID=A0ABQ2C1E5_9FLAO|nr:hypothetical protein GCM10011444_21770 [Winogradskyella haliclonae]